MNKKIISVLIIISILSIFIYTGCQKKGYDGSDKPNREDEKSTEDSAKVTKKNSEEALTNLKVELMEGQDYMKIDRDIIDFELEDLEGNKISLSDLEGNIIFLNFWATWCPPCKAEMPHMQEIYDEYQDVSILAVNSTSLELRGGTDGDKAKKRVTKFMESEGYTFPVLLDSDNFVIDNYSSIYPIMGIPTTFIIDKKGTIRYVRPGIFTDKEYMEQFIKLAQEQ